jgi:hypothetical protein
LCGVEKRCRSGEVFKLGGLNEDLNLIQRQVQKVAQTGSLLVLVSDAAPDRNRRAAGRYDWTYFTIKVKYLQEIKRSNHSETEC